MSEPAAGHFQDIVSIPQALEQSIGSSLQSFLEEYCSAKGAELRQFDTSVKNDYFLKPQAFEIVTDQRAIHNLEFSEPPPRGRCKVMIHAAPNTATSVEGAIGFILHDLREGIKSGKSKVGNVRLNTEQFGPIILAADSWPEMARGINRLVGPKHAIPENIISGLGGKIA